MIETYTIPTYVTEINLDNVKRKIPFKCGVAKLYIKSFQCLISYKIDEEGLIYEESFDCDYDYYDVELKILSLDDNVICEESIKDIKEFAEYISKEDELIYNCIEEMFYDGELENADDEVLIDKFISSIKENLDDYCYGEIP